METKFEVVPCKKCKGTGKQPGKRGDPCPKCEGTGKFKRPVKEQS